MKCTKCKFYNHYKPILALTLLLTLCGCSDQPNQHVESAPYVSPPVVMHKIVAKVSAIESKLDGWATFTRKGIHTKSVEVFYIVLDNGTKRELSVEQWAVAKVGDEIK